MQQTLQDRLPGIRVETIFEIDSTNTALLRRARQAPGQNQNPTLLLAQHQTQGRGRLGRSWQSRPQASLTFSLGLCLSPPAGHGWNGLSLAVGLSLAQSLHPSIGLKWPNDLYVEGKKLGGVLIETLPLDAKTRYAVIGVGLNILPWAEDTTAGTNFSVQPTFLEALLPDIDPSQALLRVAAPLLLALKQFEAQGFAPLQAAFEARDVLRGQPLVLLDNTANTAENTPSIQHAHSANGANHHTAPTEYWGEGVDQAGALRVRNVATGEVRHIQGGDVSVRLRPSI